MPDYSIFLESVDKHREKILAEKDVRYPSKDEYFAAIDTITQDKDAIIYKENGTIVLDYTK